MGKIIKNKAGRYIDSVSKQFVKREVYEPILRKKSEANLKRSESVKDYWKDVKKFQDLTGYDLKTARKMLKKSPKYAKKDKLISWTDFWNKVREENLSKDQRKDLISDYTDPDGEIELITY
jgi:hypothetical protein